MSLINQVPAAPMREASRRRRRLWVIPAAAVVLGVTAAAGWTVFRSDPATSTDILCPGNSVIGATSGDPVADCAEEFRQRNGTEPPQLTGYVNNNGGIEVKLANEPVPDDWTPLEDGFRQDERLIMLEAELSDISRGFPSECFTQAEGVELARRQVARLALTGWSVATRGEGADGDTACGSYYPDKERQRVVVFAAETTEGWQPMPYAAMAERLSDLMVGPDATCLTVDEGIAAAKKEAASAGLDAAAGEVAFHAVQASAGDNRPTCARPTTVVGGSVKVTIRAVPASTPR